MAFSLIQNGSSGTPLLFFMVQSSDHITGLTGATPTVKIGKNGGTGAAPAGAVSEIDSTNLPGWYKVAGNATDTNTNGPISLHATAASGDPTDCVPAQVVGFDPTQTNLNANLVNIAGSAVSTTTAQLGVNVVNIKGTASAGAAGAVAIDWANVENPTSTVALTNTTISSSSSPTAAQIATAVWQDTTAGDFTVSGSVGKGLFTSGNAPGAANGLQIAGSNAATTYATLTSTGAFIVNGVSAVSQTGDSFARIGATGSGLTSLASSTILTTAMTESYSALNATKTPTQALYEICSLLENASVSSTTLTSYKLDGVTAATTYNLNSGSNPTSRLRAT